MNDYSIGEEKSHGHGIGWGYLLLGALFIVGALLTFYDPAGDLVAFAYVFAAMAVIDGIWLIATRAGSALRLITGICDILIGLFLFANIYWAAVAMPTVFAIWFILDSMLRLLALPAVLLLGQGYFWFSLIVNILGVAAGLLLLFQPVVAAITMAYLVGFYLLLAGAECLLLAFSGH